MPAKTMRKTITSFIRDERGAAIVEYSILLAAIALGVLSATNALGQELGNIYHTISSGIASIGGDAAS